MPLYRIKNIYITIEMLALTINIYIKKLQIKTSLINCERT